MVRRQFEIETHLFPPPRENDTRFVRAGGPFSRSCRRGGDAMNRLVILGTARLISFGLSPAPRARSANSRREKRSSASNFIAGCGRTAETSFLTLQPSQRAIAMALVGGAWETPADGQGAPFPPGGDVMRGFASGTAGRGRPRAQCGAGRRPTRSGSSRRAAPARFLALLKDSMAPLGGVDYRKSPTRRGEHHRWVGKTRTDQDLLPPGSVAATRPRLANASTSRGSGRALEKAETKTRRSNCGTGRASGPVYARLPEGRIPRDRGGAAPPASLRGGDSPSSSPPREGVRARGAGTGSRRGVTGVISRPARARQAVEVFLPRFRMNGFG